jgi:hypothetical protein
VAIYIRLVRDSSVIGVDEILGIDLLEEVGEVIERVDVLQTAESVEELELEKLLGVIWRVGVDVEAEARNRVQEYNRNRRLLFLHLLRVILALNIKLL